MKPAEREAVRVLILTAQQGEWRQNGRCPHCGFEKLRGHKCSCPVRQAYKLLARELGKDERGIDDDDMIVADAVKQLASAGSVQDQRRIVWEAVEAAKQLGNRWAMS